MAYADVVAASVASEVDELARRTGRRSGWGTCSSPETLGLVAAGRSLPALQPKAWEVAGLGVAVAIDSIWSPAR